MAVGQIQCQVVDIRSVEPRPEDSFLVDTNAWFWLTYSRATTSCLSQPRPGQREQYARFIKKALEKGSTIGRCDLALSELAHQIENSEMQIYKHHELNGADLSRKEYRHNVAQRAKVVSEVSSVWSQVKKMSERLGITIDDETTKRALETFQNCPLDGYDLFFLQAMKEKQVSGILTDDGDFACVPGLRVYTCNAGVLKAATECGKLLN